MAQQAAALTALEPFILLSKSANSVRAATDLVTQATSHPSTYVFAELLETPNIQALRTAEKPEHAAYFRLLEIFSWGIYADYLSTPHLPPLSDAQHLKLRLLTLLSLPPHPTSYNYTSLQSALHISSTSELESVLISAIYAGLLTGKLSPITQTFQLSSLSPLRDVAPGRVPALTSTLHEWSGRCESVLSDLEAQVEGVRRRAREREALRGNVETAFEAAVKGVGQDDGGRVLGERIGNLSGSAAAVKGAKRGSSDDAFGAGHDEMDVDEEKSEGQGKRKASRRGLSGMGAGSGKR